MKARIIFLFSGCLIAFCCQAQKPLSDDPVINTRIKPSKQAFQVAVTFVTDDTCNLTIDNNDKKEVMKNKIVNLPLGTHRLFFESLETGKTIRNRSFRLTRDMVMGGKYIYSVVFKQQD